ncbi:hypothetical protein [Microcoleus sp. D3_18_C4]|uniref:hypothetical protein n=1 Tax=Microcoleus sp. D3_18_C4 TaxID=3055335 RepID=UPI002FD5BFE1
MGINSSPSNPLQAVPTTWMSGEDSKIRLRTSVTTGESSTNNSLMGDNISLLGNGEWGTGNGEWGMGNRALVLPFDLLSFGEA